MGSRAADIKPGSNAMEHDPGLRDHRFRSKLSTLGWLLFFSMQQVKGKRRDVFASGARN